ncbi:MAG: selenocysteine lyase/cysteine desulfurase [Natronomonas sp.]
MRPSATGGDDGVVAPSIPSAFIGPAADGPRMDWAATREQFPMLDHEIFLNAADQMAPGRYWIDGFRDCLTLYEAGRISDEPPYGPATHPFLTTAFEECIELGADLLGADPTEVTNMYRPMTAMNLVLTDLLDWEDGDNVVFTDLAYPSLPYILFHLRDAYGVELRRVENVDGEICLADLADAIDDDTKAVCLNRTTAWCGFTHDVEAICDLAHDHDAYVLDDAMQSVGAMAVDVHADDVDFLVTGSYLNQRESPALPVRNECSDTCCRNREPNRAGVNRVNSDETSPCHCRF